jgi:hypothetical protein
MGHFLLPFLTTSQNAGRNLPDMGEGLRKYKGKQNFKIISDMLIPNPYKNDFHNVTS